MFDILRNDTGMWLGGPKKITKHVIQNRRSYEPSFEPVRSDVKD